jgi:hypothetical protein
MLQLRFVFFLIGNVVRDTKKVPCRSVIEVGLTARRHPALDTIADAADAVLDVIDPVASGVGAFHNLRLDARPVLRMHAGDKHLVIDLGLRRQTPHRLHARVPVESIGLRVPRIATQANEIDCHLQPRLALAQTLLRYPERDDIRRLGHKGRSVAAREQKVRAGFENVWTACRPARRSDGRRAASIVPRETLLTQRYVGAAQTLDCG